MRHRLKTEGLLAKAETSFETHHPLKWTRAQKRELSHYQPGMILMFYKSTTDFKANEWAEVKSIQGDTMTVVKPAESRTVDLLVASGVSYETWAPPLELSEPRGGGEPITHDDVLDFHEIIDGTDWFTTLSEMVER